MNRLAGIVGVPAALARWPENRGCTAVQDEVLVDLDGPAARCRTSGWKDRVYARSRDNGWLACVGSPYAAVGRTAADPLLDSLGPARPTAVGGLAGEFALACFDPAERCLMLATDRFATIPIFYTVTARGIAFGTDFAWVCRAAEEVSDPIDPQAIYDYLFFSVVPGNRTMHRAVRKVPPASTLRFIDGRLDVARYWTPDFRRLKPQSRRELAGQLAEAISAAVAHLAPLPDSGCFLSGGLDSSTVAGMASRHARGALRAFTIGFDVPDYDESAYARISARHFGLDLRDKTIRSADVTSCIDRVVAAFPEPFGNASAVSTFLCAQFARDSGVTHLLAGDGGDELFAGNERYQKQTVFDFYGRLPTWLRRGVIAPLAAATRRTPVPLNKLSSYVRQAEVPLPDRLFSYNLLVRNSPNTVLTEEFLARVDPQAAYDYARAVYHEPPEGDPLDRMLYLDWALTLTDNDLPKVRIACELAGVAAHFPMLDAQVVELSTLVPSDAKLTVRRLRKFYKEAFRGFLPPEVIAKPKHGFGVPVGIWISDDPVLRDRVFDRLRSLAGRGIVRADFIAELLKLQQTDHAIYYGALIWSLFMLEEWFLAHGS